MRLHIYAGGILIKSLAIVIIIAGFIVLLYSDYVSVDRGTG